jgi:phosphoserine phosphatase
MRNAVRVVVFLFALMVAASTAAAGTDALPSWNDGAAKSAIIAFVQTATDKSSVKFVPPEQRIAVFDNDGTLWASHPMYVQLAFALNRVKALAPLHPAWKNEQPFKAVLEGDPLLELVMATHAGMTTEAFSQIVLNWLATARHPKTGRLYTGMVYQPMLELLAYLRANGFTTYIVSGGGIEFMRPWTERIYGIPPEQVIGSSIKTKYELRDGKPLLVRLPEINFIDDKAGKPVGINQHIGRRPVAAFGNSDGDIEMLQYTDSGKGAHLEMLVLHDDAGREYAYTCDTKVGRLCKGLTLAKERGWQLISMKNDWKIIFPEK